MRRQLPIPMAMATGAVHQALVAAGLRTLCGMAVEAGDCRDIHHAAVLIGYGAGAVCPWLALETARALRARRASRRASTARRMMLKALDAGHGEGDVEDGHLRGGQLSRRAICSTFWACTRAWWTRCFPGTPAPLSGIGFAELDRRLRESWQAAGEASTAAADLPDFGWVRFRKADVAEPHMWQPPNVKALQTVVGSARGCGRSD